MLFGHFVLFHILISPIHSRVVLNHRQQIPPWDHSINQHVQSILFILSHWPKGSFIHYRTLLYEAVRWSPCLTATACSQMLRIVKHSPEKHPLSSLALTSMTVAMETLLQAEKRLLLGLSPEVALANMMKFPDGPPGEQSSVSGSCCNRK